MQVAIEPDVGRAFNDIDEFLFGALGMRKGCAPARRQALVMNAQFRQAEIASERRTDAHQLVVIVIMRVVWPFDLAPVDDKGGALRRCHGNPPDVRGSDD
uniref:Uncharacterized protein n=1 Tax=Rhizobium leguminosarum TaxID=384 RepID=A0A154IEK1_RHILE|nr:hypothetical protein A4A59_24570 [Rhizobium leguminosarum]